MIRLSSIVSNVRRNCTHIFVDLPAILLLSESLIVTHSTNLVTLPSVWFSAEGEVSTKGKELAILELDTVAECSHLRHLGKEHSLLLASKTSFSVDEVESETETGTELKLVSEPGTIYQP